MNNIKPLSVVVCLILFQPTGMYFDILANNAKLCAQGKNNNDRSLITSRYEQAKDPMSAHSIFAQCINSLSNKELDRLRFSDSDQLAIRSAWEIIVREYKLPESEIAKTAPTSTFSAFIGFVEGRARFPLPYFFYKLRPAFDQKGNVFFDLAFEPQEGFRSCQNGELLIRNVVDASFENDFVVVNVAKESDPLRIRTNKLAGPVYLVDAIQVESTKWIVRFFSHSSALQSLLLFDTESTAIIWHQAIWCGGNKYSTSQGPRAQLSSMVRQRNNIFIAGVCNDAIYVEGFNLSNGAPVLRFGSSY